jgi:DivIVA domain-containing protein
VTEDRRVVISSEPHLTPEEVSRRTFATVFRGFDPTEVRAYLRRVSDELGVARERQRNLEHLLSDAQRTSNAPPPPLDEATLTAALGEETARVLHTARQAAVDIKAKAEENVERILRQAHEDAARIREESEGIYAVKEAEANAATEAMRAEAQAAAEAVVEGAREQAREMLEEAKQVRAKVLGEVVRRRNVARVQVSQLRAGRDRLLDAYRVVRETLDEVTEELGRAEDEARAKAEAAGEKTAADLAADTETPVPDLDPELLGEPAPIDLGADLPEPALAAPEAVAAEPESAPEAAPDSAPEAAPAPEAGPAPSLEEPAAVEAAAAAIEEASRTEPPPAADEALPTAPLDIVEPPSEIEAVRIIVPTESDLPSAEATSDDAVAEGEAPEPEDEALVPEGEAAPEDDPEPGPVDDLFARIRAGRADAVAQAQKVLADSSPADMAPANGTSPNGAAPTVTEEDPADALLAQREKELEPIQAQLAKRLKRAMQDEQNDVLDRLRVHKGRPELSDALPDAAAQGGRYRDVAAPLLEQAARAGAAAAGNARAHVDVVSLVGDLADAVTGPLRSRLGEVFTVSAREDDDATALTERVGAAYREWKMQRIERLAADHLFAAHAFGGVAAVPAGTPMRWVVHDVDGPCPDCDDNALAGPTPAGETFPTGQTHPPAHAGCHCLLVKAP